MDKSESILSVFGHKMLNQQRNLQRRVKCCRSACRRPIKQLLYCYTLDQHQPLHFVVGRYFLTFFHGTEHLYSNKKTSKHGPVTFYFGFRPGIEVQNRDVKIPLSHNINRKLMSKIVSEQRTFEFNLNAFVPAH